MICLRKISILSKGVENFLGIDLEFTPDDMLDKKYINSIEQEEHIRTDFIR